MQVISTFLRNDTKTGAMCERTGIFKPLRIQLKCRSCFHSNFSSIYDMPRSYRLLASIGNSYNITINHTCDCDLGHHNNCNDKLRGYSDYLRTA